jgi:phospholipid/cholesterol/gamma-HCH transport system substrate-binding protein
MSWLLGRVGANLAVVIVVSMVVLAAAGFRFIGAFGGDTRELVIEVPDAGGVLPAQPVTVYGHGIGVVTDIRLTVDGAELLVEVDRSQDVPRHAFVQVLRRSPIGEQAVELTPVPPDFEAPRGTMRPGDIPRDDDWQPLGPDEELDIRAVATPPSVPAVLRLARDLLETIDVDSLVTVVDELGTAFDGRHDVLRDLTRDGTDLSETVLASTADIERLLEQSEPVLDLVHDQRDELRAGLADSAELLETLGARGEDVVTILESTPGALDEATRLIDEQAPNLSCLNADLLRLGQLLAGDDVLPYLAQLLDNQRYFYGSFDAGTQWDPYRPQAMWARVNILLVEAVTAPAADAKDPRTPTPPTLPGAHCESPFGLGVDAVRQPDPIEPDPTSPGIDLAPRQEGAGDRADHALLRGDRD